MVDDDTASSVRYLDDGKPFVVFLVGVTTDNLSPLEFERLRQKVKAELESMTQTKITHNQVMQVMVGIEGVSSVQRRDIQADSVATQSSTNTVDRDWRRLGHSRFR